MANKIKTVLFDGEKLRDYLTSRGYNLNRLSEDVGYASNYYTDAIRRGKMSIAATKALELKTGITFDDFIVTEPKSKSVIIADSSDVIERLDTIADYLDKLLTGVTSIIERQDREIKYLSHIMRNTRHFETFEETIAKSKAESLTMKVKE